MRVFFSETKIVRTQKEVPDRYAYDDSVEGKIVDILIDGKSNRDLLFCDDRNQVERICNILETAYIQAGKIIRLFPTQKT